MAYKPFILSQELFRSLRRAIPSILPFTISIFCILLIPGCSPKPESIDFGEDLCEECKTTIVNPAFGGEIITKNGKVYKFDDAPCMIKFLNLRTVKGSDIAKTVFINHANREEFLDVATAQFLVSPKLKSPMGSNAAAYSDKSTAMAKAAEIQGRIMDWETLYETFK